MRLSARTTTLLLALSAGPALACPHDSSVKLPFFGQITLYDGFDVDPFKITLRGGGFSALRDCGLEAEGLVGYAGDGIIDARPQLLFEWQGEGRRLAFTTEFEEDTLLVIRDPEGSWHFDDNGREHNPLIVFNDPESGEYAIFIGAHGTSPIYVRPGELIITETGP